MQRAMPHAGASSNAIATVGGARWAVDRSHDGPARPGISGRHGATVGPRRCLAANSSTASERRISDRSSRVTATRARRHWRPVGDGV